MIYFSTEKILHDYEPKLSSQLKAIYRSAPTEPVGKEPEDSHSGVGAYQEQLKQSKKPPAGRAFQELTARDVMTSPVTTLKTHQSLKEAFELLKAHQFRHFAVLDEQDHLVGMISDRDVMGHAATQQVSSVMTSKVLATDPDSSLRDMSIAMLEQRVGCLPVVQKDHALLGIVTRSDILQALITHAKVDFWV